MSTPMSRTWTMDERLTAFHLDFTTEERELARRVAEADFFARTLQQLPRRCSEYSSEHPFELSALDIGILRVHRRRHAGQP